MGFFALIPIYIKKLFGNKFKTGDETETKNEDNTDENKKNK